MRHHARYALLAILLLLAATPVRVGAAPHLLPPPAADPAQATDVVSVAQGIRVQGAVARPPGSGAFPGDFAGTLELLLSGLAPKLAVAGLLAVLATGFGKGLRSVSRRGRLRAAWAILTRWTRGDFGGRVRIGPRAGARGRLASLPGRLAAVFQDGETVRRKAQVAERRLAEVLSATTDAVVGVDRNWIVTFANPQAAALCGPGAVGRPLWDAFPDLGDPGLADILCTAMRGAIPHEREARLARTGRVCPLRALPSAEGLLLCLREAPEPRAAQGAPGRGSVPAEDDATPLVLSAAAHDLRQPLQSLVLFAGILEGKLAGHEAAPVAAALNRSLATVGRMIEDLMDMCRLETAAAPEASDVALGPLLGRLAAEYAPYAEAHGLQLRTLPATAVVRSDPGLLERMVHNLVEHALHRAPAGGRVVIGVRRSGAGVRLTVAAGADGAQEDRPSLGLAVVRRLGALLGHPVTLVGGPGAAMRMAIDLPLARPLSRAAAPLLNGAGLALVIEDEAVVREGLRRVLEGWGWDVVEAASGGEAVGLVAGRRPDLILADYQLEDGARGTDAIRHVEAACGVPVPAIVLTGDTAPEREREIRAGGHALMHKPLSAAALRRLVETLAPDRPTVALGSR